jgi:hypothetical protein
MFLLDVGAEDGVSVNDPVVVASGLVGVVREVGPGTALAMDWTHPDFRVSVMTEDGGAFGIAGPRRGTFREDDRLLFDGIPYYATVTEGALVLTSGMGSVYPRGILVGEILDAAESEEGGTAAAGAAIGLRLDGLAAGDYFLFVMARNVNSNVGSQPMNIFATAGLSDVTFDFSSLTANPQSNVGYASAGYAGEYNSFVNGENYVGVTVSVGAGESLFLAVDAAGTGTTLETRGFINSVAVAPVPEPSALALLLIGGLGFVFVRRIRRNLE